jgi:hypothetical protein
LPKLAKRRARWSLAEIGKLLVMEAMEEEMLTVVLV